MRITPYNQAAEPGFARNPISFCCLVLTGEFSGLISIEDVLSELLGDILDELKQQRLPQRLRHTVFRLPGEMRSNLVVNCLGVKWPAWS